MRFVRDTTAPSINAALRELWGKVNLLGEDTGEQEIPTSAPRVPKRGEARIWFDEETDELVVVTSAGVKRVSLS